MTTTPPEAPKLPIRPATAPATIAGFSPAAPAAPSLTPGPERAASTAAALKSVKPSEHVIAGTALWTVIGVVALLVTFVVLGFATWGIGLLLMWVGSVMANRKLSGTLRGGALRVGPKQFPEIHERVTAIAAAMGITKLPEVYILESNTQNAFATKHGKKNRIVLVDDMVFGAGLTGNDQVLTWILAHELAHIALGHTGAIRGTMRSIVPPLSRLDELTCDRVATAIVNDSDAVRDALTLLLVGPQLFSRVNHRALKEQADEFMKTSKGERKSAESRASHPLLLHRYAKVSEVLRAPRPVRPTTPQVQPTQL